MRSANLNVMIKTARRAARSLVKDFREVENLQVSVKGAGDFVSRADREAERIIKEDLRTARPTYGWLGEETGEDKGEDPTRRWVVDPLDGTTNFLHGQPHWCISIALEHKGEAVAGVIFDPARDEMFVAEKGGGAWMNDQRLRVSARKRLGEAVLATGVPVGARSGLLGPGLRDIARVGPQAGGVRCLGAAALDLAWLAAGRVDAYWERGLQPWDVAAGIIILREAGGFVEAIQPGRNPLESGDMIAAAPGLFEGFAKLIRDDG